MKRVIHSTIKLIAKANVTAYMRNLGNITHHVNKISLYSRISSCLCRLILAGMIVLILWSRDFPQLPETSRVHVYICAYIRTLSADHIRSWRVYFFFHTPHCLARNMIASLFMSCKVNSIFTDIPVLSMHYIARKYVLSYQTLPCVSITNFK